MQFVSIGDDLHENVILISTISGQILLIDWLVFFFFVFSAFRLIIVE